MNTKLHSASSVPYTRIEIREMSKMPCRKYLSSIENKRIEASAWKLPKISP
jgi:hypothetical protein